MPYKISTTVIEGFQCVRVEGIWPQKNSAEQKKIFREIFQVGNRQPPKGLIVDIRNLQDVPSVLEDYDTAKYMSDAEFYKIGPIAFLDTQDRKSANDFFENVATNRGVNLRFFYDSPQDAINWLSTQ